MIIALCGEKGSGKDTVASKICELYSHMVPCKTIAFADPIKKVVQHIFDLDPTDETQYDHFKRIPVQYRLPGYYQHSVDGRHVVREIGMLMRGYNEQQFVDYVHTTISKEPNTLWIVTDLRFDNEYDFLRKMGATIVKIEPKIKQTDAHITERGFEDSQCDLVFKNDVALGHLGPKIIEAFDNIIKEKV